jgi:hypothetical protein
MLQNILNPEIFGLSELSIVKLYPKRNYLMSMKGKKWQRKNVNIIGTWLLDAVLVRHFMY